MKVFSKVMLKQFNLALDKNVMEAGSQLNQDANEVNEVLKNMQEEYNAFSSAATNNARDVNSLCGKQSSLNAKMQSMGQQFAAMGNVGWGFSSIITSAAALLLMIVKWVC